jgi:LmbE family N-acetylglucosaminyl deacetylase
MKIALVIAAHPDDEVLGCGATIARLVSEGWAVHILIAAEGATSRSSQRNLTEYGQQLSDLEECTQKANQILGSTSVKLLGFPDNRMDKLVLLDIVKQLEEELKTYKPSLVFTHHAGDVNIDHQILHHAVITACRPQPGFSVKSLLFFEVPSSTEWRPSGSSLPFVPNYFWDVSMYMEKKIQALDAYKPEMRDFPHPRSIRAINHLAGWRGASVGCEAAEAFMLGRTVV